MEFMWDNISWRPTMCWYANIIIDIICRNISYVQLPKLLTWGYNIVTNPTSSRRQRPKLHIHYSLIVEDLMLAFLGLLRKRKIDSRGYDSEMLLFPA